MLGNEHNSLNLIVTNVIGIMVYGHKGVWNSFIVRILRV